MDPDERVQRPTMVAGWQVRRTSDGERRRGQELLDRQAIAQFPQGGFEDPAGLGLLDELYQRLDVIGKPHGPVHDLSPLVPSRARRARTRTADTPPVKGTGGRRECIAPCRWTHCSNLVIWQVTEFCRRKGRVSPWRPASPGLIPRYALEWCSLVHHGV